jgi:hypothetical protein
VNAARPNNIELPVFLVMLAWCLGQGGGGLSWRMPSKAGGSGGTGGTGACWWDGATGKGFVVAARAGGAALGSDVSCGWTGGQGMVAAG